MNLTINFSLEKIIMKNHYISIACSLAVIILLAGQEVSAEAEATTSGSPNAIDKMVIEDKTISMAWTTRPLDLNKAKVKINDRVVPDCDVYSSAGSTELVCETSLQELLNYKDREMKLMPDLKSLKVGILWVNDTKSLTSKVKCLFYDDTSVLNPVNDEFGTVALIGFNGSSALGMNVTVACTPPERFSPGVDQLPGVDLPQKFLIWE